MGLLENPEHSLQFLSEIEEIGEDILRDRQEIVALDRRRNQNRESLRAISNRDHNNKLWMSIGSLLVKVPIEKAKKMLENGNLTATSYNIYGSSFTSQYYFYLLN